jgi:putative redox protein
MTENAQRHAHIAENGRSPFAVDITVSGFTLLGDEPVAEGGGNLGPAPYDTLLAALGECTVMTVRWYAQRQGWPLEKAEARLTHRKDGKTDIFEKEIILHGDGLTAEHRAKLVEVAGKCPVQRTLEGTPVIRTLDAGEKA